MKVNFVCVPGVGWAEDFISGIKKGFESFPKHELTLINVGGIEKESTRLLQEKYEEAGECDVWYFMRNTNWFIEYTAVNCSGLIFAHRHGGRETGQYVDVLSPHPPADDFFLTGTTLNSQHHKSLMPGGIGHGRSDLFVTGFPLHVMEPNRHRNPGESVIIPGRLSPSKQTIFLANTLRHRPGLVTFCTAERCIDGGIAEYIKKLGFRLEVAISGQPYLELLANHSVCLTAGMSDTLNISAIDAWNMGCRTVIPDCGPYNEFWSPLNSYRAYVPSDILRAVFEAKNRAQIKQPGFDKLRPEVVVGKLIRAFESLL